VNRNRIVGAVFVLVFLAWAPGLAIADPYPMTARYLTASELPPPGQPWLHATGNLYCGQLFSGSYGTTSVFSNAEMKVNYGGTCNAAWPRPANNLASHVQVYVNYSLTGNYSNLNAANTSVAQTLIPRYTPATTYIFEAGIFNGTGWINLGRCVGANCS